MRIPGSLGRPRGRFFLAALAALTALAALACGGSDPTATPAAGATSTPQQPTATPQPKPLVIYAGRSEALVGPIIQQFQDLTGIEVQVNYAGTGPLAATLLEESANTPADIYFAQDPGGLGAVINMLDVLPSDVLNRVPEWARSPEGKWVGLSGRARVLIYNTAELGPEDLPQSIEELADPKWKDKLGWAPTNASFQAMVTGMRLLWGEDRTRAWLQGVIANGVTTYNNNGAQVDAASRGEILIGMVNHYYLYQFLAERGEGFGARNWFTPAQDPGSVVLVAGAGVLSASDNKEAAYQFLSFMLSQVGQQFFASQTYEYPLVEGVSPQRYLPSLDEINKPDIDLSDLGDLENTQALLREVGAIS